MLPDLGAGHHRSRPDGRVRFSSRLPLLLGTLWFSQQLSAAENPETYRGRAVTAAEAAENASDAEAKRILIEAGRRWRQLDSVAIYALPSNLTYFRLLLRARSHSVGVNVTLFTASLLQNVFALGDS
jgi:hypothetical protein